MTYCPQCNTEQAGNFCQTCGTRLITAPPAAALINQSRGDTGLDRSVSQTVVVTPATASESDNIGLNYCPVDGLLVRRDRTFRCKRCGREHLCREHLDSELLVCMECAAALRDRAAQELEARLTPLRVQAAAELRADHPGESMFLCGQILALSPGDGGTQQLVTTARQALNTIVQRLRDREQALETARTLETQLAEDLQLARAEHQALQARHNDLLCQMAEVQSRMAEWYASATESRELLARTAADLQAVRAAAQSADQARDELAQQIDRERAEVESLRQAYAAAESRIVELETALQAATAHSAETVTQKALIKAHATALDAHPRNAEEQLPGLSGQPVPPVPGEGADDGGWQPLWQEVGVEMVTIPAGVFLYGPNCQRVMLPEYQIARTPVTNAQYWSFVQVTGWRAPAHWQNGKIPPHLQNHPVVNVSWEDALAFCKWVGCRLPTEQEWEKAARGADGREYPWGHGWEVNRCNTSEAGIGGTTPVDRFPRGATPYGVLDMAGNVSEWCNDWFDASGTGKVLRGGSWLVNLNNARCTHRFKNSPGSWGNNIGFRCCRSIEPPPLLIPNGIRRT